MQDHTQFILITHNRKTMEIANRLYGVTMEEPGVSKLISIQMN
jgi:chromosome segregation protein